VALISVEHLVFAYESDGPAILDGLSFEIEAGERLAILGGNGSGKSTLAQWIAGWLPRGTHKAAAGSVLVQGRPWSEVPVRERTELVQFVGQLPMQQLSGFAFTVWDEVVFGPGNLALPAEEVRRRAEEVIAICHLDHLRDRDPFSLSGGEQQRLSIAAALAMKPQALVLDEPTGNFDPESRDALLTQMAGLPRDLTTIWCDVALLPPMALATRFLLLDEGRIVLDGDAATLLAHPRTREIFGLPAVAEAALQLREQGLLPAEGPLPATLEQALPLFGGLAVEGHR